MCGLGQQAELPDLAFLCVNYSAPYGTFLQITTVTLPFIHYKIIENFKHTEFIHLQV